MKKIVALFSMMMVLLLVGCDKAVDETTRPADNEKEVSPVAEEVTYIGTYTYVDPEYAFSLTFPESWQGFNAESKVGERIGIDNIYSVDFTLKGSSSIFMISVFTKEQWQQRELDSFGPIFIAENDNYVYSYNTAQDVAVPGDDQALWEEVTQRVAEVEGVIKTFELK